MTILYGIIGVLTLGVLVLIKTSLDKDKMSKDSSRQLNELRATYQKMEYQLTTYEKRINDLNAANKTLQDELDTLLANPLVNSDKVNNRTKKK
jgi:hypothetical protein